MSHTASKSSVHHAHAGTTTALVALVAVGVLFGPNVPATASRTRSPLSSVGVLEIGDRLKVGWVYTPPVSAKMVELEAVRHLPDEVLIRPTVRAHLPIAIPKVSVASACGYAAIPCPASTVDDFDLLVEPPKRCSPGHKSHAEFPSDTPLFCPSRARIPTGPATAVSMGVQVGRGGRERVSISACDHALKIAARTRPSKDDERG